MIKNRDIQTLLYTFICVFILGACNRGLIPKTEFLQIIEEMYETDERITMHGLFIEADSTQVYDAIFHKHGYDSAAFFASAEEYFKRPEKIQSAIKKRIDVLQKERDKYDEQNSQEVQLQIAVTKLIIRLRDSLPPHSCAVEHEYKRRLVLPDYYKLNLPVSKFSTDSLMFKRILADTMPDTDSSTTAAIEEYVSKKYKILFTPKEKKIVAGCIPASISLPDVMVMNDEQGNRYLSNPSKYLDSLRRVMYADSIKQAKADSIQHIEDSIKLAKEKKLKDARSNSSFDKHDELMKRMQIDKANIEKKREEANKENVKRPKSAVGDPEKSKEDRMKEREERRKKMMEKDKNHNGDNPYKRSRYGSTNIQ